MPQERQLAIASSYAAKGQKATFPGRSEHPEFGSQHSVLRRDILPHVSAGKPLAVALRIVAESHGRDPETRGDPGGGCGRI